MGSKPLVSTVWLRPIPTGPSVDVGVFFCSHPTGKASKTLTADSPVRVRMNDEMKSLRQTSRLAFWRIVLDST